MISTYIQSTALQHVTNHIRSIFKKLFNRTDIILEEDKFPHAFEDVRTNLFGGEETIFDHGLKENIYKYTLDDQIRYISDEVGKKLYSSFNPFSMRDKPDYDQFPLLSISGKKAWVAVIDNKKDFFLLLSLNNYELVSFFYIFFRLRDPFPPLETKITSVDIIPPKSNCIKRIINPTIKTFSKEDFIITSTNKDGDNIISSSPPLYISPIPIPIKFKLDYNLEELTSWGHRSGWKDVMTHIYHNMLRDESNISSNNSNNEILLVDFVERIMGWNISGEKKNIFFNDTNYYIEWMDLRCFNRVHHALLPTGEIVRWDESKNQWILASMIIEEFNILPPVFNLPSEPFYAFWHNPHNMPLFFDYENSPQMILKKKGVRECFSNYCQGIFVFSEYFASFLRQQFTSIPVIVVNHPTESIEDKKKFNWTKYVENKEKKLYQIGYWLRDLSFIWRIKGEGYKKVWLYSSPRAIEIMKKECMYYQYQIEPKDVILSRLSNNDYDEELSKNVALIPLYDASVNNAVIECIARHTPFLVSHHPSVVELLGEEYPLYFTGEEECDRKLQNINLIYQAHEYLKKEEIQNKITFKTFIDCLIEHFSKNNIQ